MKLTERVAIVTGGAHRVGGALTAALAGEGATVMIHYGSSAEAAEQLAERITTEGGTADTVQADLTDPAAPARVFEAAAIHGPVSILVNSAAGFPTDRLGQLDRESYDRALATNLTAPVFMMDEMARRLPDGEEGAVVNITDWRIERPYGNHFSYLTAKGALATVTRAAAIHLAPHIRVNAVALGAILPPPGEDQSYLDDLVETIPVKRAGGTGIVASAVVELLTNDFVTGQIWRLDGGASLA